MVPLPSPLSHSAINSVCKEPNRLQKEWRKRMIGILFTISIHARSYQCLVSQDIIQILTKNRNNITSGLVCVLCYHNATNCYFFRRSMFSNNEHFVDFSQSRANELHAEAELAGQSRDEAIAAMEASHLPIVNKMTCSSNQHQTKSCCGKSKCCGKKTVSFEDW